MISLAKRYRQVRPEAGEFMPPNLLTFDAAPFGDPQRTRLAAWLGEAGWPRHHMEIAELEGYLVGLIAWPVGISSGAWLPRIWGETGWKVPTKISARARFDEFVALTIGFLHDLDSRLSRESSRFESSVLRGLAQREQAEAQHCWGRGFMTALTLGSQGLAARSASARGAVRAIANATASSAQFHPQTIEEIVSAVRALMEQRSSRGPLGPLEVMIPTESPKDRARAAP
jgi:yecA family protein